MLAFEHDFSLASRTLHLSYSSRSIISTLAVEHDFSLTSRTPHLSYFSRSTISTLAFEHRFSLAPRTLHLSYFGRRRSTISCISDSGKMFRVAGRGNRINADRRLTIMPSKAEEQGPRGGNSQWVSRRIRDEYSCILNKSTGWALTGR